MRLDELLKTVECSSPEDWHRIPRPTVYNWDCGNKRVDDGPLTPYLEPVNHDYLAVYKPDVDISLAFGANVCKDFQEPWVRGFPDSHASSVVVELRYRGSPVYEEVFVVVDGGRNLLPMPKPRENEFVLPRSRLAMARLMYGVFPSGGRGETQLEEVLKRAGVKIE